MKILVSAGSVIDCLNDFVLNKNILTLKSRNIQPKGSFKQYFEDSQTAPATSKSYQETSNSSNCQDKDSSFSSE